MSIPKLIEGEDFCYDDHGHMIFTEKYLLKRGHCCQSGCRHCPYGYHHKVDPLIPAEFNDAWSDPISHDSPEEDE